MGKKIDRFVLSVLIAVALYLYFYHTIRNHAAALALAGICFWLIRRLFRKTASWICRTEWHCRRQIRRHAGGSMMYFACADAKNAEDDIAALLQEEYHIQYAIQIVQQHPSSSLAPERIFEIWKNHRGEDKLVICATCSCSTEARNLAQTLQEPRIAILDANALCDLITRHPEFMPDKKNPKVQKQRRRLKAAFSAMLNRRNTPRFLFFSALMLMMYLLGGSIMYLAASMLLLFAALGGMRHPGRPAKLF